MTITPRGAGSSRSYSVNDRWYMILKIAVLTLAALQLLLVGSWVWLFSRSTRTAQLEEEVVLLEKHRSAAMLLARRVQSLEREYERLRLVFTHIEGDGLEPWMGLGSVSLGVDPFDLAQSTSEVTNPGQSAASWYWPLTEAGIVTRGEGTEQLDHPGIDIAVSTGTYVRASRSGTVVDTGDNDVYGNFVIIDHGEGYSTQYAHLLSVLVVEGDAVRAREVIALSGSTGISTGPHLHFELRKDGEVADPLDFLSVPR